MISNPGYTSITSEQAKYPPGTIIRYFEVKPDGTRTLISDAASTEHHQRTLHEPAVQAVLQAKTPQGPLVSSRTRMVKYSSPTNVVSPQTVAPAFHQQPLRNHCIVLDGSSSSGSVGYPGREGGIGHAYARGFNYSTDMRMRHNRGVGVAGCNGAVRMDAQLAVSDMRAQGVHAPWERRSYSLLAEELTSWERSDNPKLRPTDEVQVKAVVKVQAQHRGRRIRHVIEAVQQHDRHRAAVRLQSRVRILTAKVAARLLARQRREAIRVQAWVRGREERLRVARRHTEMAMQKELMTRTRTSEKVEAALCAIQHAAQEARKAEQMARRKVEGGMLEAEKRLARAMTEAEQCKSDSKRATEEHTSAVGAMDALLEDTGRLSKIDGSALLDRSSISTFDSCVEIAADLARDAGACARRIYLHSNSITCRGAIQLAAGVWVSTAHGGLSKLSMLNLNENRIGCVGAAALFDSLRASAQLGMPLQFVNLSSNCIADQGAEAIASGIASGAFAKLESLSLASNLVASGGCAALEEALQHVKEEPCSPALRHIDLTGNRIPQIRASALCALHEGGMLAQAPSLSRLILSDQEVAVEAVEVADLDHPAEAAVDAGVVAGSGMGSGARGEGEGEAPGSSATGFQSSFDVREALATAVLDVQEAAGLAEQSLRVVATKIAKRINARRAAATRVKAAAAALVKVAAATAKAETEEDEARKDLEDFAESAAREWEAAEVRASAADESVVAAVLMSLVAQVSLRSIKDKIGEWEEWKQQPRREDITQILAGFWQPDARDLSWLNRG